MTRKIFVPVLLVVASLITACGGGTTTMTTQEHKPSVGTKLAAIQNGHPVEAGDPLAAKFDRALDSLQEKCTETRITLSDDAIGIEKDLKDAGINESLYSILHHIDERIPKATGKVDCDFFFLVHALRRTGPVVLGPFPQEPS